LQRDTHKRSVIKTITYRMVVSSILATVTWSFTGNLAETSTITLLYNGGAIVFYYVHERLWNRVKWGTTTALQNPSDKKYPLSTMPSSELSSTPSPVTKNSFNLGGQPH
jgi:uncharacterized membrane protein